MTSELPLLSSAFLWAATSAPEARIVTVVQTFGSRGAARNSEIGNLQSSQPIGWPEAIPGGVVAGVSSEVARRLSI